MSELREAAVEQMRDIVGGENDPLSFVCALAADPKQDVQLRLSAASIALPFLYPRLSASQVAATHTVVKVDHAAVVARLSEQISRLAAPPPVIEAPIVVVDQAAETAA